MPNSAYKKAQIFIKGIDETHKIIAWADNFNKIDITYKSGKTYSYNKSNVRINYSVLYDKSAYNCFKYLKNIAFAVGLQDPLAGNILLNHYDRIDFVDKDSMLAAFLTGKLQDTKQKDTSSAIFPFGFNISQKSAVDKALTNPLTIIEGPPGTGKTQTILNIIANAVMRGESVAVVSANNSATANVLEKLQKYKVSFIAAYLGNSENKSKFLEDPQTCKLPDLSLWEITEQAETEIKESVQNLHISLNEMLNKKNEFAKISQELHTLKLEYQHFCAYSKIEDNVIFQYLRPVNSSIALKLWLLCEKYVERKRITAFFVRITSYLFYGVKNKSFFSLPHAEMITICQKLWYMMKIGEISSLSDSIKEKLDIFNIQAKMNEYTDLSVKLFLNELRKKYKESRREPEEIRELWRYPEKFIVEFPVILSTTYSVCSSLSHKIVYDYVIIDESSQVDIATGALALSCARKAVIWETINSSQMLWIMIRR